LVAVGQPAVQRFAGYVFPPFLGFGLVDDKVCCRL
jgi:hypothetical protein